jgi:hypothetical protein
MKKIVGFLILTFCMLALLSVGASAQPTVDLSTEIEPGGTDPVYVNTVSSWNIIITISTNEQIDDVVVKGGIGADLVVAYINPIQGTVNIEKKGKGKMGAKIVTWDIGVLDAGTLTLVLTVETGLNPKDKQEFTSAEEGHELDGGFSATYTYDGIEDETLETEPLTVDVVGEEEE